ncbi:MAG: thymidine phosphorylase [Rhodothermales bacterium]
MPSIVDLIYAKREGQALSRKAITHLIDAYTAGDVPDYQMSAFLMAAFLRGLNTEETAALTHAMLHSGEVLNLAEVPGLKVDKHSTGGVGDKVSLILAPLVAACGVPVPMISGRSLGHSGGTLDKLESIPGFRTDLNTAQYRQQLADLGVVMIGQTAEIAPADRKLYALRDVTATVEFIPFIAASIMSKKLAEGIDALVLDVKVGQGAFMKTEADARTLAETLVGIGEDFGKPSVALLTEMHTPLGYAIGNWPEVEESIACLKGAEVPDLMEVTYALAGEMLWLGKVAESPEAGVEQAKAAIASGAAFEKFVELVERQGGDVNVLHHPEQRADREPAGAVIAPDDFGGYITGLDALALGQLSTRMGSGRETSSDAVDPTAGITLEKHLGDPVQPGEVLAHLHTRRTGSLDAYQNAFLDAVTLSPDASERGSLLYDRYYDGQWHGIR